jgi:PEP-CTERM motif-containing protein
MKRASLQWAIAGLLLVGPINSAAHASIIDFQSVALGTSVPFTVTTAGTSATFTSTAGFLVGDTFFSTLTGHVLFDADALIAPLFVAFNQPLSNISLNFALNTGNTSVPLTLSAFLGGPGGTLVGATQATGAIPPSFFFPEGLISFAGAFDTIRLSTTAQDFAVDNLNFTPASTVPEPSSLLLMATGAVGVVNRIRMLRRQARRRLR